MKRGIVIAVVVLVLVVLVAVFVAPLLAVQNLRDALVTRDASRLAEMVDPGALRSHVQARTREYYGADTAAAAAVTDALLSPQGLNAAICDAGAAIPAGAAPPFCPISTSLGDLRLASPARLSTALRRPEGVAATVVLERQGLRWRLTDLVLAGSVYDRLRTPVPPSP